MTAGTWKHAKICPTRGALFYNIMRFSLKQYIIKQLLDSVFCDIRNNQGLDECYQPQPSPSADNTYLDLDYSRYHKNLIQ